MELAVSAKEMTSTTTHPEDLTLPIRHAGWETLAVTVWMTPLAFGAAATLATKA